VMLIALALMFSALGRRARALAAGAVAAPALMLALMVFNELARGQIVRITPNHFLALLEAIWFMQLVASHAGPLLALLAAAAAVPAAPRRRGATAAYAALVVLLLLLRVLSFVWMPSATFGRRLSIVMLVLEAAAMVAFVLAAFWRARALERSAAPPTAAADAAPARRDPGPFRLLGRTIIVRLAVGAPLAIIATVGAARSAPGAAMLALVAGTITGLVVTAMLVTSLAGQRQLPAALCDREALMIAIVLACLAPVFDVWSAVSTGQLLSLVGEAKHATSFWGMPSLGRIEELQTAANWTGRISICLGLAGSFAIVRSLTATARGLVDETLAVRAGRVRALLIYGTGGAVT